MISNYEMFEGKRLDKIKKHLHDNWGKYVLGATGAGINALGYKIAKDNYIKKTALSSKDPKQVVLKKKYYDKESMGKALQTLGTGIVLGAGGAGIKDKLMNKFGLNKKKK